MKVEKKTLVTKGNKEIKYTHIQNNAQVVCFMFSGAGYTYDKPLFYYSTMSMLENNYDVVHVHYTYSHNELRLPMDQLTSMITEDVDIVVKEVIYNGEYRDKIFLGKSLGTIPIASKFANNSTFSNSKLVILTPLLKHDLLYKGLMESNNKTLLVIGKDDDHYIPEKIKTLAKKTNFRIKEIANANHSLDIRPLATSKSLAELREIITSLNDFLQE